MIDLLHQTLTLKQYLADYNSCLSKYFSLQKEIIITQKSQDVKDVFSPYINNITISYQLGQILAHELNYIIEKHTNNTFTLDHYIKKLATIFKKNLDLNFSSEIFSKLLWDLYKYDASNYIQKNIIEQNFSLKASTILNGKAKLTYNMLQVADYGFDLYSSSLDLKVKGVKINSTAYEVGLRNGQQIKAIWYPNSYQQYLTLEIENNKITKIIKINPTYKLMSIPQYVPT